MKCFNLDLRIQPLLLMFPWNLCHNTTLEPRFMSIVNLTDWGIVKVCQSQADSGLKTVIYSFSWHIWSIFGVFFFGWYRILSVQGIQRKGINGCLSALCVLLPQNSDFKDKAVKKRYYKFSLQWESNPGHSVQSPMLYHWATPSPYNRGLGGWAWGRRGWKPLHHFRGLHLTIPGSVHNPRWVEQLGLLYMCWVCFIVDSS